MLETFTLGYNHALIDIYVYGVDLVSVIFWTVFAHDKQAPPQASWCGGISYNSRSHLVILQGEINSARYIAQVNPVLLSFLLQEGYLLFQHDNVRPDMCTTTALPRSLAN